MSTLFLQTVSPILSNLWSTQTLEWDHLNNDLRVRISLCSCTVQHGARICLGCLSSRGTRLRSIPAHRSSWCHRDEVAIFIFVLIFVTLTSVFLHILHSTAQQPLISVFPARCRAGAYACTNTLNTSLLLSFAMPSAISLSHSSPVSLMLSFSAGNKQTLWPELCDEEGTFGPLVVYASPVNVFYFYLLGV